jgi:hypothetical protein
VENVAQQEKGGRATAPDLLERPQERRDVLLRRAEMGVRENRDQALPRARIMILKWRLTSRFEDSIGRGISFVPGQLSFKLQKGAIP